MPRAKFARHKSHACLPLIEHCARARKAPRKSWTLQEEVYLGKASYSPHYCPAGPGKPTVLSKSRISISKEPTFLPTVSELKQMTLTWDFRWFALRINGLIRSIHGTEIKAIITKKVWTSCCKNKMVISYHFKIITQHTYDKKNANYRTSQWRFILRALKHFSEFSHLHTLTVLTANREMSSGSQCNIREALKTHPLYSLFSKQPFNIQSNHM